MEQDKKRKIKILVQDTKNRIQNDFIAGKGSGLIFLLHGPPGVGKTLTAESVAELLHRPLYSVTIGDFVNQKKDFELSLKQVLKVAADWNAVLLIDEADVFLEKRKDDDINRNALVSLFLKNLEYHSGVIFLTTNRIACIDDAFQSRINVALQFEPLDFETRKKMWELHLKRAGHKDLDCGELANIEANGREIRNIVHLASIVAADEKAALSATLIKQVLKSMFQFPDKPK